MQGLFNKLIVALDSHNIRQAKKQIDLLYPNIKIFKIGSVLFTGYGPSIVNYASKKGAKIFLDLKYYDIPNTVANAVHQAVKLKVHMISLHIQGGKDMLRAAVLSAKQQSHLLKLKRPLLIGITVLTSQVADKEQVLELTRQALEIGLDGVVCSAQEVPLLRKECGDDFVIITPGIRARENTCDDQKRIATAQQALKAGADYIVVGRPITTAKDPLKAAKEILQQ